MACLTGANGTRLLVLMGILTLLSSTACWARVYDGSYGDSRAAKERMHAMQAANGQKERPSSLESSADRIAPYEGAQGIHVRATGTATAVPDLAIISPGVESVEMTASEARGKAANAKADVMQVLEDAGVEERDIQTRYFNISPQYQSVRVTQCHDDDKSELPASGDENCTTIWEQKLVGYAVTNQLSVRVRDLEETGTIIDRVTDAAGDLARVNGISFTIEDNEALQDEARVEAMAEMQRKASMMADLAGVDLGKLVHLEESARFNVPDPPFARATFASAESAADTSISAGEVEVAVSVNGVYLISGTPGQ